MQVSAIDPNSEWARRRRRHTLALLGICAVGLVPWTILLAVTLPRQYDAHHWRLAWVGFDMLLLAGLAATAYLGWRGRQMVIGTSVATAMLLICDAWFDVSLDLGTPDVWMSLASAVFIELPLAALLIHRSQLLIRLTVNRFYEVAGYPEPPGAAHKIPLVMFDLARIEEREMMIDDEREHDPDPDE